MQKTPTKTLPSIGRLTKYDPPKEKNMMMKLLQETIQV